MRRALLALSLLAAGYLAGTVAPHASAADSIESIASELRGIRSELQQIRRAVEKMR